MTVSINPSSRWCWETCSVCYRCANAGRFESCNKCSGYHDPNLQFDKDPYSYCDCTSGILRWRSKDGRLIVSKYKTNPFKTTVKTEIKTQDEADWDNYLNDMREKLNNPNYNPLTEY